MKQVDKPGIVTHSADETLAVARTLAAGLHGGDIILLRGDLGTGKTLFARGIAEEFGVQRWRGSPTFTLINEYPGPVALYHLDLYRLGAAEAADLGLEDYARSDAVVVVEWPERAPGLLSALPGDHWTVDIAYAGDQDRIIHIAGPAGC